jgi:hypothetical protein
MLIANVAFVEPDFLRGLQRRNRTRAAVAARQLQATG